MYNKNWSFRIQLCSWDYIVTYFLYKISIFFFFFFFLLFFSHFYFDIILLSTNKSDELDIVCILMLSIWKYISYLKGLFCFLFFDRRRCINTPFFHFFHFISFHFLHFDIGIESNHMDGNGRYSSLLLSPHLRSFLPFSILFYG